ncbi:DUF1345 domain-containing protein [Sinomonas mesophila]|uniref:DUF1345 domain-containing protein n=1 Tax=Sinomonas mesophila TaxID=1531955 RepID=UPI001FE85D1A|nr:DUF1345 domain-containing protein [Sinomonas mesophila]
MSPEQAAPSARARTARTRLTVMAALGAAGFAATGLAASWWYAPAVGWGVAALVYDVWVWSRIAPMDVGQTRAHALEEDPSRRTREFLILCANAAAIIAVILVMISASGEDKAERVVLALVALLVVSASWLLVHTLFTLRYTELYYTEPEGGIGFNQEAPPSYTDIAYMAFSLGMTFQVSDTAITDAAVRAEALKHSLLAYVFSTLVLASTVNLVIGVAA